ncbi:MAG: ESX secretion-associated protein EspG [Haloechinothrix sp.]
MLSTVELDVLWAAEKLPPRHVVLDVPSPGATHSERARIEDGAWAALADRGLADGRRASGALLDMLGVLATPLASIDVWVWADRRISALAASTGAHAMLGVIDGDEVWLIPARDSSLAESAVSVIGELHAGVGQSVTVPHGALVAADAAAKGAPHALVTALQDRGVELWQAQELAGMFLGTVARGQFGVQRRGRDGQPRRASRVAGFHDTDAGRYLFQLERTGDGSDWCTLTPADNRLLAQRVWELLDEV